MTLVFGCSMTVCANPEVIPDGTIFDAEYYAQAYPDVTSALGTAPDILYQRYAQYGKSEGRLAGQDPNDINNCTMYEYDANNNLIKETSYYSDGSFKNRYEYKYDSNGNKINGALYSWDYEYQY